MPEIISREQIGWYEIVLAKVEGRVLPYVTWFHDLRDDAMHHGHYYSDSVEAWQGFLDRIGAYRQLSRS